MRRAAEIAAQVFTARDAMLRDTAEDLRVAFLLFDSAAEVLMYRHIQGRLHMGIYSAPPPDAWGSPRVIEVDLNNVNQKAAATAASDKYIHWVLSASSQRSILREFESKLRLLAWDGEIPSTFVSIIGRLHQYRNEMYHRDESRPEALRTVVPLYAWLIAELLERLPPMWTGWLSSDSKDLLPRTYKRMGLPPPDDTGIRDRPNGRSMQEARAMALRRQLSLDGGTSLFADYVKSRVETVHGQLQFVSEYLADFHDLTGLSEWDVIRLLHTDERLHDKMSLYADEPVIDPRPPTQRKIPVTRADLNRWDNWHSRIGECLNPLDAFHSLAEFERQFEPFETRISQLTAVADSDIQHRWDLYRGK